jgi:hypothetical protein
MIRVVFDNQNNGQNDRGMCPYHGECDTPKKVMQVQVILHGMRLKKTEDNTFYNDLYSTVIRLGDV